MHVAERLAAALADRYRIERELGAGGMATVYLAEDLKHDRKVAIKVLKPELAAVLGADRFVVEIKTTASLQHPHILPLFDSGTADGFLFYVMPFIQGETIREKLNRETQFGVDEAIRIAREVADALDYAHRHGVIHRDIKPENILLHDGRAMVMDFGIALAVSAAAGGRMTETGLSLGTPHYMSPEQATAEKEITPRSDVYSLASVLYEMLAGQPPHIGGAAQQVIMKIITEHAQPVTSLRKSVPPNVSAALAKALEKLPADRFENAKAFGDALANPAFMTAATTGASYTDSRAESGVSKRVFIGTAAVAVLAVTGFAASLLRTNTEAEQPVLRVAIDMPAGDRLWMATTSTIAISPNGDMLAYVVQGNGGVHLVVRRTSDLAGRTLSPTIANQPAFSPDGKWLAFADGDRVSKVAVDGGASISVGSASGLIVRGLAWLSMDTILVGSDRGLFQVASAGGELRRVPGVDSTEAAGLPVLMPDGRTVAYNAGTTLATRRIALTSLESHTTTVSHIAALSVIGMREGHLLYITSTGELYAVPVDLGRQRFTGDPVQVEAGIRISPTGGAIASLSASGSLWFVAGQATGHLVRVGADRSERPVFGEQRTFRDPRFSPDGRRIAVEVATTGGSNIWVYDVANSTFTPVTTEAGYTNASPEWSSDGKRVLFRSIRDGVQGVWWQPWDGSGTAELLYQPNAPINEALMSPDGKWLLYRTAPGKVMRDIFAVSLDGERTPTLFVGGPAQESHARFSPNSKWVAYQTNESGRFEIFVRAFPGGGARTPVTNQGGTEPVWSPNGDRIYYRTLDGGMEAVAVATGSTFTIGQRRSVLPPVDYLNDVSHTGYDIWPDGNSFLMVKPAGGEARPILVHNWGRELREKLAGGSR